MERKVSLSLYAGALVIAVAIFLTGVYLGTIMDRLNMQDLSGEVNSVSQKVSSLQLLLLMEGNSSSFCPVYTSELASIDSEVEHVGYKLSYLEDEKKTSDPELKKSYFVLEAQSYLLSQKVRSLCGDKTVLLINFYSNKDCSRCRAQGEEILSAREDLSSQGVKMKLFSFDGDLGSPVADALRREYGVTTYPSVVIDGHTYPGYHDSDSLKALIKGG